MKNRKSPFLVFVFFVTGAMISFAQTDSISQSSFFDYLYEQPEELLEVTIETDMKRLIRQKYKEEYQKAKVTFHMQDTSYSTWQLKLRARGNSRKQICFYPPVKLKFKKDELKEKGFAIFNDWKLVNLCKSPVNYNKYLVKEYLVYKLYNVLTPNSLRARMIKINYIDSRGKAKPKEMYAFIIEPIDELAHRLDGQILDRKKSSSRHLETYPFQEMSIFQFMIGNTDWAVGNVHNMKLMKVPEFNKLIAIPYDWDYSGLVDTDYAVPFETLPIKDVKTRLYRGTPCSGEYLDKISKKFQDKKEEFFSVINTCTLISDKEKRIMTKYLSDFYNTIDNKKARDRTFN